MRGKGTWIAIGLFVLLGVWVMYGERGEVRAPGTSPPLSEMVGMKPEDVRRVEMTHEGRSLVLVKAGKEWQITKPVEARADDTQVQQMLADVRRNVVSAVGYEGLTQTQTIARMDSAFVNGVLGERGAYILNQDERMVQAAGVRGTASCKCPPKR